MQTATLGGLIKDYRIKKRLSQVEVSVRIGWNDTTRLSKIEQGRVGKPTRETIDKIMDALELTEYERGDFLLVGGYLPTDTEILKVIESLKKMIWDSNFPVYIMDFTWRFLYANDKTFEVLKIPFSEKDNIYIAKPHLIEFAFRPEEMIPIEMMKGDSENIKFDYKEVMVAKFKVEQKGRENEKWYVSLIKRLMKDDQFRLIWPKIEAQDFDKKLLDYEFMAIQWKGPEQKVFKFHAIRSRVIQDPRFQVIMYIPADM